MKTNKLILAALAAIVLAACSKDNETQPRSSFPEDGQVRITAGVDDIVTRAGVDNTNITTKEIGFFFLSSGNATYTYSNVKLTYNGSEWTSGDKKMYWADKTSPVGVWAYAPWQDGIRYDTGIPYETPADQSEAAKLEAADWVCYKSDVDPKSGLTADGKINLPLQHALSKIVLEFTMGTDVTDETPDASITSILIRGLKKNGMLVLDFGKALVSRDDDTPVDIQPCPDNGVYEAIFLPQEVTAGQFSVEVVLSNAKTYVYALSDAYTFEANYLYNLSIRVGTSTPKVAFPKTSIIAGSWNETTLDNKITD